MKRKLIVFSLLSAVAVFAAPVFNLNQAEPLEKREVRVTERDGRRSYELNAQSRLRFAFDAEPLAEAGTVVFAVTPGESYGADPKNPEILLQLGTRHWLPNSLTVYREKDNLFITFFGHQKRLFRQFPRQALKAGQLNTLAVSWDAAKVRFYLNGRAVAAADSTAPIKLGKDTLTLGSPVTDNPLWHFAGRIEGLVIDGAALADAAVIEIMRSFEAPPAAPATANAPYVSEEGDLVRIGGDKFELQVGRDGSPRALYDKLARRYLIRDWSTAGGNWWSFTGTDLGKERTVNNTQVKGEYSLEKGAAVWRYTVPENGSRFTLRVKPDADGALRFHYELLNGFSQPVKMVYFPQLGGFDKGRDSWAFLPWWYGVRRDLKKDFQFMSWGGPGHLSMLLIALKLDDSTLLLHPEDAKGSVRFAMIDDRKSGPDGYAVMSWQNRDWIQPGENFTGSAEFVLRNLGDSGLRGVAESYRLWAEKQPWFVTYREKMLKAPVTDHILNGVIKMGGFEAVNKDGRVYDPSIESKEKLCNLTFNYHDFLKIARRIEEQYKVKPAYRYDGWWDRFDSRYPDYFPVNPRLGDFGKFLEANQKDDRLVYFHTNPIQYDFQSKLFDIHKQAMSPNGGYQDQVWSRNRLYVASPRPALPDQVAAIRQMREQGARGIFEDVIGSTTMLDVNPAGGYKYWHRDSGTEALLELAKALREASGDAFRGTEGGEERRLPYYDAFMMGAGRTAEHVPFINLVYGDCIINATGIEGGGSGRKPLERARGILFGLVLGLDGRHAWAVREYAPSAQLILETQKLLKATVGVRMIDYKTAGDLCFSEWPEAFSAANIGKETAPETRFRHEKIGEVVLANALPESAVHVDARGRFAAWGIGKVTVEGKLLFDLKDAGDRAAVVYDGATLAVGNLSDAPLALKPEIPNAKFSGEAEIRPSGKSAKIDVAQGFTLQPGEALFIR